MKWITAHSIHDKEQAGDAGQEQDNEIKGVMEMFVRKTEEMDEAEAVEACNMPVLITMAEHNEIKGVMEMLGHICGTEEIFEAEGHMDIRLKIEIMVDEIILQDEVDDEILTLQELNNVQEESWIPVKQMSKGKSVQG
jgi:hypothetical protein